MGAAPQGPGDDGGGSDVALRQARSNMADFLHRPADQRRLLRIIGRRLFWGAGMWPLRRMAASIAKASMARDAPPPTRWTARSRPPAPAPCFRPLPNTGPGTSSAAP